jgi:hypothetical protein
VTRKKLNKNGQDLEVNSALLIFSIKLISLTCGQICDLATF